MKIQLNEENRINFDNKMLIDSAVYITNKLIHKKEFEKKPTISEDWDMLILISNFYYNYKLLFHHL